MANIKSQMKRNRQNEKARQRNQMVRSEIKTRAKTAVDAATAGDATASREALKQAQARIDVAATRGVLHAKTAARRKSKLTKQVNTLLGS
ncbi:MAG: 30S ribosomal protein S20 [Acidimicrobiia bacterium]|nr:30S ribosomal protein S20 [Acidimicrobiia bacterium]MBT8192384.1 30S ribosomal protein S20 [Acidimicrobiia bacterium]MBT8246964.1 30S ribosomal protein S20 [Acidimicrobiia bacterium]NNF87078.1 30S ribosomal protein S20 [Acidimicrobiia bacterium]NNL12732.1 30S ribosomal protein S20 [Acidimicrobiia bacterium]